MESKRQTSVGECVYGKTLPSASIFENHQPHNSFDANGMLKMESWTAMDQLIEKSVTPDIQKEQQNETVCSDNDLFKKPHNLSSASPNQHTKNQQEQNVLIENPRSEINSIIVKKDENIIPPGSFSFWGNIFGENKTATSSHESVFKLPNAFTNSLFKSNTSEPLSSNIFGGIIDNTHKSKATSIFEAAAIETANIFKQQSKVPIGDMKKDNVCKLFQNNSILHIPPTCSFKTNNEHSHEITKHNINDHQEPKTYFKQFQNNENSFELRTSRETLKKMENQVILEKKENIKKIQIDLEEKAIQEFEEILNSFIDAELFQVVENEVNCLKSIIKASDLQTELLITEVINMCVDDIANEEYALMCYDQLLLNRYFSRWLLHLRKKKEQRILIENTPLWITTNTRAQYAQALEHPYQQQNMEMIKRYRLGQPCDFENILKLEQCILNEENHNPINLFALVGQHLLSKQNVTYDGFLKQRKYFKFLITLPENKEELLGFENFFNNWLMRFIKNAQLETGPFVHGIEHNVALCVRKFNGINPKNEQGDDMTTEGDHNDGIVCIITGVDIYRHSRKRLYNLLKLTKNLKRVPLAIIAYNCSYTKEELIKILDLDTLQREGFIYSYIILGCQVKRKDFSFRKLFISAVSFITKESLSLNSNEMHALAMLNAKTFLEITLGEEIWQRWSDSASRNPIFNKICSLPEHAIGIFHKALDHLLHIIQEDFQEMPEFPEDLKEFVPQNICSYLPLSLEYFPENWKTKTKKDIKTFLQSLYLPNMDENIPDDIEGIKLWLLKYSSICIDNDDVAATKATYEAITNLVNQINLHNLQNFKMPSGFSLINYLIVIKPIIFGRINNQLKRFHSNLVNLNVFYLKDDLKNFQTQPWWLNYEPLNFVIMDYGSVPMNIKEAQVNPITQSNIQLDDIDKILSKAEIISRKTEDILTEFNYKKYTQNKTPTINLSSTLHLKRKLDDTVYSFELSKKIGQYDTSFLTNLTSDIDKTIDEVLEKSSPTAQKRKRSSFIPPDQGTDIERVIAKAMKVIEKIESTEDQKFKTNTI